MTYDIDIEKHRYDTESNYAYSLYKKQNQPFSKQLYRVAVVIMYDSISPCTFFLRTNNRSSSLSFFFATLSLAQLKKMTDSAHLDNAVSDSYIRYSTVKGYFLQDDESTDPKKFDYVCIALFQA
jgi:hypothetical protein